MMKKQMKISDTDQESSLERKKEIKELKLKVETLEWENARLSLKLISVNGAALGFG